MKRLPEVLLKKPRAQWSATHIWVLRLMLTMTGFFLWILLLGLLRVLSPHLGLPRYLVLFITWVYPIFLLVLSCQALPIHKASSAINDPIR